MTLTEIRNALESRGLRPLKQLGQNFLHDQNLARALAGQAVAGIEPGATVVEIGPGLGALTEILLEKNVRLITLEMDRGLCVYLREKFAAPIAEGKLVLREGDALETLPKLDTTPAVICGNLPYYISTPLLAKAIDLPVPPQRMVLTLQKEVAERLAAKPGTSAFGSISVLVQSFYAVKLIRRLPPTVFYPQPEVDSAAVRLDLMGAPPLAVAERAPFQAFVRKGFSQRRKKLSNTLGIADDRRPEQLSVEDWIVAWRGFKGV